MPDPALTTTFTLADGQAATVRPLRSTDVGPLADFFLGLLPDTRRVYGPHPFDRETAERLTSSIDTATTLRFVALLDDGSPNARIIGYVILTRDIHDSDLRRYGGRIHRDECASLAPVIADAYQDQGIGTLMARHVIACAKDVGLRQVMLMGGVRADNPRAQRLYTKLGFLQVGEFWLESAQVMNYDMMIEL